jgi:hypothetical protein
LAPLEREHVVTENTTTIRKHCAGCYRVTLTATTFGQVHLVAGEWHGEIRATDTGTIVRHTGIWTSRRAAIEEIMDVAEFDAAIEARRNSLGLSAR